MDGQFKKIDTKVKVEAAQVEKLVEWVRRSGRPQNLKALTKRYIEILKEGAGTK
jgi:Holliday junction resolvase